MENKTIYKDGRTEVKEVWYNGRFLYTVTYVRDEAGFCKKMVRVWFDGKVEEQE